MTELAKRSEGEIESSTTGAQAAEQVLDPPCRHDGSLESDGVYNEGQVERLPTAEEHGEDKRSEHEKKRKLVIGEELDNVRLLHVGSNSHS